VVIVSMTEREIDRWVASQNLPPRAGYLFRYPFLGFENPHFQDFKKAHDIIRTFTVYAAHEGGHLEIISQFIASKNHCVESLRKICELLESDEHMMIFCFCLHRAWMIWGIGKEKSACELGLSPLAKGCSRSKKADEIRGQIKQKTEEIVGLVNGLAEIGGVHWISGPQSSIYAALLQRAVDIQSNSLPEPIRQWADWVAYDASDGVLAQKFQKFSGDIGAFYGTDFPMPTFESLMLAYGQQVAEDFGRNSPYRDALKASKRKEFNPAFFARGFLGLLSRMVDDGLLPEKIKTLRRVDFDRLFNPPFPVVEFKRYVDSDWRKDIDTTAEEHERKQKKEDKRKNKAINTAKSPANI